MLFAGDGAADAAEEGEGVVLDQVGGAFDNVLVPVITEGGQGDAGVAADVVDLGAVAGDGDLDVAVVVEEVGDVGELGAAGALEGGRAAVRRKARRPER